MKQFYVAYSSPSNYAYIIAVIEADTVDDLGEDFILSPGKSKVLFKDYGQKMLWTHLVNKNTKEPIRNARTIFNRFKLLEKRGWRLIPESVERFKKENFQKKIEKKYIGH